MWTMDGFVAGLAIGILLGILLGPVLRSYLLWREVDGERRGAALLDEILARMESDVRFPDDPSDGGRY